MPSPLTRQDYLDRVSTRVTGARAQDRLDRVSLCLPTAEDEQRLREMLEGFLHSTNGYAGLLRVVDLSEAKAVFTEPGFTIQNWHYDRLAQVVLFNLRRGRHEALSAALTQAYRPELATGKDDRDAEIFLDEGLGWFLSSSSLGRLLKGKQVQLTAQEKLVFSSFQFF